MRCYDEDFKPVLHHDLLAPTMEVIDIDHGRHTFRCLLCAVIETRDLPPELILTDNIAFGGGSDEPS